MPLFSPMRLLAGLGALLLLLAPAVAGAQAISLDEGSFRLLVAGREVGTETFTIRQTGAAPNPIIIAQGSVVLDTASTPEELRSTLRVEGPALRPAAYDLRIQPGGQQLAGRIVGGRFSAMIRSPAGEQMREYVASDGTVLVDDGVTHHHYFLARRVAGGSARVPILIPRQSRQVSAEVTEAGRETIDVGGQRIQARRLTVTPAGLPARNLWVDDQARVLKLEIPGREFVAQRIAPPR